MRGVFPVLLFLAGNLVVGTGCDDAGGDADVSADADADADNDSDSDADADADNDSDSDADVDSDADADIHHTFLVGVYDDTAEPDASAWAEGLDLIEAVLDRTGLDHRRIDRPTLNDDEAALESFDAVVFGGGFAYPGYTLAITAAAKARLRDFVERGGVFVGICAGAYFACDAIRYEGEDWADESGYDLDLFPGTCVGPLATIASYPDHGLVDIDLATDQAALSPLAADGVRWTVWYAAGPWFETAEPSVVTLASYAGETLPEAGERAIVAVPRGAGVSLLFGPHPEIADAPVGEGAGRLLGDVLLFELENR